MQPKKKHVRDEDFESILSNDEEEDSVVELNEDDADDLILLENGNQNFDDEDDQDDDIQENNQYQSNFVVGGISRVYSDGRPKEIYLILNRFIQLAAYTSVKIYIRRSRMSPGTSENTIKEDHTDQNTAERARRCSSAQSDSSEDTMSIDEYLSIINGGQPREDSITAPIISHDMANPERKEDLNENYSDDSSEHSKNTDESSGVFDDDENNLDKKYVDCVGVSQILPDGTPTELYLSLTRFVKLALQSAVKLHLQRYPTSEPADSAQDTTKAKENMGTRDIRGWGLAEALQINTTTFPKDTTVATESSFQSNEPNLPEINDQEQEEELYLDILKEINEFNKIAHQCGLNISIKRCRTISESSEDSEEDAERETAAYKRSSSINSLDDSGNKEINGRISSNQRSSSISLLDDSSNEEMDKKDFLNQGSSSITIWDNGSNEKIDEGISPNKISPSIILLDDSANGKINERIFPNQRSSSNSLLNNGANDAPNEIPPYVSLSNDSASQKIAKSPLEPYSPIYLTDGRVCEILDTVVIDGKVCKILDIIHLCCSEDDDSSK